MADEVLERLLVSLGIQVDAASEQAADDLIKKVGTTLIQMGVSAQETSRILLALAYSLGVLEKSLKAIEDKGGFAARKQVVQENLDKVIAMSKGMADLVQKNKEGDASVRDLAKGYLELSRAQQQTVQQQAEVVRKPGGLGFAPEITGLIEYEVDHVKQSFAEVRVATQEELKKLRDDFGATIAAPIGRPGLFAQIPIQTLEQSGVKDALQRATEAQVARAQYEAEYRATQERENADLKERARSRFVRVSEETAQENSKAEAEKERLQIQNEQESALARIEEYQTGITEKPFVPISNEAANTLTRILDEISLGIKPTSALREALKGLAGSIVEVAQQATPAERVAEMFQKILSPQAGARHQYLPADLLEQTDKLLPDTPAPKTAPEAFIPSGAVQGLRSILSQAQSGKGGFDVLAQGAQNLARGLQQVEARKTLADLFAKLKDGAAATEKDFADAAQATRQLVQESEKAESSLGNLWKLMEQAEKRSTRYELLSLFRQMEDKAPILGYALSPESTILRQVNNFLRTGGIFGDITRMVQGILGSIIGGITGFISHTLSTALGFIIGNVLLAPFKMLGNVIGGVVGNLDNFIKRGFELNYQQDKTREEVERTGKIFDKFLLVITKPAYDFVIQKFKELTSAAEKMTGLKFKDTETAILGLGNALGTKMEGALQSLIGFGQRLFGGGGAFDPTQWLEAGAQLAGQFAAGLINGFLGVVIPAVTALASMIAGFFIGKSPPPLGALRNIINGGRGLMQDWMRGMLSADFSVLDSLTSLVESRLRLGVALKKGEGESGIPGAIINAREIISSAMAEITLQGNVAAATMAKLKSLFGDTFADVQNYLNAVIAWRDTTIQVEAAQNAYNAAAERTKQIQEQTRAALEAQDVVIEQIQNRITAFQNATAEIPERFTRGRRRELELELQAAQQRRQDMQRTAEAQQRAAQMQVDAAQKQLDLAQKRERQAQAEMQMQERLIQEDIKRNQLLAQQASQKMGLNIDWASVTAAGKQWEKWINEHVIAPFQEGLGQAGKDLEEFLLALSGQKTWHIATGMKESQETPGSKRGSDLRKALDDLFSPASQAGATKKLDDLGKSLGIIADVLKRISDWWDGADPRLKNILLGVGVAQVTTGIPGGVVQAGGGLLIGKLIEGIWKKVAGQGATTATQKAAEAVIDKEVQDSARYGLQRVFGNSATAETVASGAVPSAIGWITSVLGGIWAGTEIYFSDNPAALGVKGLIDTLIAKPLRWVFDRLGEIVTNQDVKNFGESTLKFIGGIFLTIGGILGAGIDTVVAGFFAGARVLKGLVGLIWASLTGGDVQAAKDAWIADMEGTVKDWADSVKKQAAIFLTGNYLFADAFGATDKLPDWFKKLLGIETQEKDNKGGATGSSKFGGGVSSLLLGTQDAQAKLGVATVAIGTEFDAMATNIATSMDSLYKHLFGASIFPDIMDGITGFVYHLVRANYAIAQVLRNWLTTFYQYLGRIQDYLYQWLRDTFGSNLDAWFRFIDQTWDAYGYGLWQSLINGLSRAAAAMPITNYLKTGSLGKGGVDVGVPSLDTGGFILRSGLAYVHAGEIVAPANQVGGNITIQNVWPDSIAQMDRSTFEQVAEDVSYRTFTKLMKRKVSG